MNNQEIEERIRVIEEMMNQNDFWIDKDKANELIKELKSLKFKLNEEEEILRGDALIDIIAGAGGTDSEDWARMLMDMYLKYLTKNNFVVYTLHEHRNELNGIKNVSIEVKGDNAFRILKNEAGVHRLVRISPFNANSKRHTSFALVEVTPLISDAVELDIKNEDLEITFQKGGGPGGQNVNKRETNVRIVHKPTNISVHVDGERTQEANKEKAIKLIRSKIYELNHNKLQNELENLRQNKDKEIEWGNQIRNYVLHPYKLVKDLRSNVETSDIDSVLEGGLDPFIIPSKEL
jgi:peptide chain release factor 2